MSYVCKELAIVNDIQTCVNWIEHQSIIDVLSITKDQMYTLGSAIVSIYAVVIAFVAFSNFMKRA